MKTLRELRTYADDQAFLCNDADTIAKYRLPGPFKCGQPSWKGGNLLTVLTYLPGDTYATNIWVGITSLTPLAGETFHNNAPAWNSDDKRT